MKSLPLPNTDKLIRVLANGLPVVLSISFPVIDRLCVSG
jgi:hypothetical protein